MVERKSCVLCCVDDRALIFETDYLIDNSNLMFGSGHKALNYFTGNQVLFLCPVADRRRSFGSAMLPGPSAHQKL